MGLFSKSEKEKIEKEYDKDIAHEAFCIIYTHDKYSNILQNRIDHRRYFSWYRWFVKEMSDPKHEKYLDACMNNLSNTELIKELQDYDRTYLCQDMIKDFETSYALTDFSKEFFQKGYLSIYNFIASYGEERGHAFLVAFSTTAEFCKKIENHPEKIRLMEIWITELYSKLKTEFGNEGYLQYRSLFGLETDYKQENYVDLVYELYNADVNRELPFTEFKNPFLLASIKV